MKHLTRTIPLCILCIIFLVLIFINCSSLGRKSFAYKSPLGLVTTLDFNEKTDRVFTKYQYVVVRNEKSGSEIYVETQWKDHLPFDDEQQERIVASRTRIILRARPRLRSSRRDVAVTDAADETDVPRIPGGAQSNVGINKVEFIAEYMVQYEDNPEWQEIPMSKTVKDNLKRIADELKMEFVTGIRKF